MALIGSVHADDGVEVRAVEQGDGPPILIVHGGQDDGSAWRQVAERLSRRWRVVRLHRRQYRLDLAASFPVRSHGRPAMCWHLRRPSASPSS
jgi:pimeloyl-ACP methyl ester carboxylesterase